MRFRFPLALGLVGGLAASGCNFENDYAVTVTWLINGTAPSQDLCDDEGVDRVRFTILSPGTRRVIEGNCSDWVTLDDGYDYGGFDTTSSFDYGVRYTYRVEMLDRSGRALSGLSYSDYFLVDFGDAEPYVLAPLELFSPDGTLAALTAEWGIDGRDANASDCARLGATTVAIDVASSTDDDFEQSVEIARADCATGFIDTGDAVLAEGEYLLRYVALDANDDVVQAVYLDDEYYQVDQPGTLDITGVDFDL